MTSAYLVADETVVNREKNIYIEKYGTAWTTAGLLDSNCQNFILDGKQDILFPAKDNDMGLQL